MPIGLSTRVCKKKDVDPGGIDVLFLRESLNGLCELDNKRYNCSLLIIISSISKTLVEVTASFS